MQMLTAALRCDFDVHLIIKAAVMNERRKLTFVHLLARLAYQVADYDKLMTVITNTVLMTALLRIRNVCINNNVFCICFLFFMILSLFFYTVHDGKTISVSNRDRPIAAITESTIPLLIQFLHNH